MRTSAKRRIVEICALLPGAYCTRLLAQAGWDVLRIEPPGGDPLRRIDPELHAAVTAGTAAAELDLRAPDGQQRLAELVADADALLESFRPSTAGRLRLAPEQLWATNPRLVVASLRGYPAGPAAERAGHDINYMAAAGAAALCVDDEGRPVYWGTQVSNFAGGLTTAFAILAATTAQGPRKGRHVVVDLASVLASWVLPRALLARRLGSVEALQRAMSPPAYGFFQTADGNWVSLGVREEKFERSLAAALGLEFPLLRPSVAEAVRARPWSELERAFAEHDVPFAPVCDPQDLLRDPAPGGLGDLFVDGRWTLGIPGLEQWVSGEGEG